MLKSGLVKITVNNQCNRFNNYTPGSNSIFTHPVY